MSGERIIRGDGTPETVWRAWSGWEHMATLALDDWLSPGTRLVVVAPHPDDEVLACGGLLSVHAARGGECLVVAVTDGEASHVASSVRSARALAVRRREESRAGLALLSAHDVELHRLGLPDGAVRAHHETLCVRLQSVLRPGDRVVSTWRLDGHPDHDATGEAAARACARVGAQLIEAPIWMWHWAAPDDPRVPWQRMRRFALRTDLRARKRRALAAHASQFEPRDACDAEPGPVLGPGILSRLERDHEYFLIE